MSEHVRITIGVGGLLYENGQALLVQTNYGASRGNWIFPGGLVEPGEFPTQALEREFLEETGLKVKVRDCIAFRYRREDEPYTGVPNIYLVFRCEREDTRSEPHGWNRNELQDVRWWPVDKATDDPQVRPQTRAYLRMLSAPQGLKHIDIERDQMFGCSPKDPT